jgi:tRNA C32,U32 (ribose-2'-O)-methylase TrmJ
MRILFLAAANFSMKDALDNLRIVLVATRNPLNIGAAARAMSNFGAGHLRVVRPYEVAFREARSAVGAADILARAEEFETVSQAVADCRLVVGTTAAARRELQHDLRILDAGARIIRGQLATGPVALLFGSEKVGLSNDDFSHCHWLMRIPTRADHDSADHGSMDHGSMDHDSTNHGSMNLGQAVAVCLYEIARSKRMANRSARRISATNPTMKSESVAATAGDIERMTQLLFTVLAASDYVKPRVAAASEEKLRRMVRRMRLCDTDAQTWLGMLRQIAWKLSLNDRNRRNNQ